MYTRLTSPSRMSAHTTHSRSRSPWLWAFLIMFMIWGVWVLLPQPDHLAASSDISEQQQHAKTFSSLANAQPATSPSDDLKSASDNDEDDGTENSVVADAITSLLDDDSNDQEEIKSSATINSEEIKEEDNDDDEDDNDDNDEDEEETAQPTESSKPSPALSSEPTSIIDIDTTPSQTFVPASSDSSQTPNNGVGIVVHTHDDDNNSLVLEEPTKTIDPSQAQITSVTSMENGEKQVTGGEENDQEDDVEGEDSFVMSITAVSWPAATDL